jgi:ABC-type dipeptide transport system, periplasmic component
LLTAIDRERISKDVYQGLAFPAMNAIPEQFTMLTDPSVDYNKQFAYDPAKAGKMLDEAGFPSRTASASPSISPVRSTPMPSTPNRPPRSSRPTGARSAST